MKPIWIVDDDQSIRFVLEKALARESFPTRSFVNIRDALQALEAAAAPEIPQVLVSDIRMPGGSGIDLLSTIKKRYPEIPVIIMTAYSDLDSAVAAFQGGAFEYLSKPFDLMTVVELIRRAMNENQETAAKDGENNAEPGTEIIGQAPAMQDVFRAIGRLSQSHVTVLITGESGAGKELVAQALHKHSPRANGPFIAINTAAIPKDLLESELFGHERGAFTGAQNLHRGRFEQAEGGTLFLDEIGDMPFDLQTRLLRVLSDGNFYRVGGHIAIKANVRVIAATHQNLEDRVKQGLFREDLFHRLNVIRLRLPSLSERREDIPLLAKHFLKNSVKQLGGEVKKISDDALQVLSRFSYPGNVRQLENICHWLTVMAPAQVIQVGDLPAEVLQEVLGEAAPVSSSSIVNGKAGFSHISHVDENHASEPVAGLAPPVREKPGYDQHMLRPDLHQNGAMWESLLEAEILKMLAAGTPNVWDELTKRVETCLINSALHVTRGRRIEAAQKLGIGRNTITRKIQDLHLDD